MHQVLHQVSCLHLHLVCTSNLVALPFTSMFSSTFTPMFSSTFASFFTSSFACASSSFFVSHHAPSFASKFTSCFMSSFQSCFVSPTLASTFASFFSSTFAPTFASHFASMFMSFFASTIASTFAFTFVVSCGKVYIGKTGCPIQLRLEKNHDDIIHECTKKYALAEHSVTSKHHICIEDAKVIARIDHYMKRCVIEAIEIEKHPKNINRDDGWKLSKSWTPIMTLIKNSRP